MSSPVAEIEEETPGRGLSVSPRRDHTTLSTTHWPHILTHFLQYDKRMIKYHPPGKTEENRLGKAPLSLPQVTKASCHFLSGQFPETDEYCKKKKKPRLQYCIDNSK